ncbi:MAG: arginine--tRNA ligase, partial [Fluviicola sp.]
MENTIKSLLIEQSLNLFGSQVDEKLIQFQKTKKEFEGDTTLVLFPFLKIAGKKPNEIGEQIGQVLLEKNIVASFNII